MSHIRYTALLEVPDGGFSSSVCELQHNHLLTRAIGVWVLGVRQDATFNAVQKVSLPKIKRMFNKAEQMWRQTDCHVARTSVRQPRSD